MTESDAPSSASPPAKSIKRANWKNFVAGGVGGCLGTLVTCPLEVVKTRFQSRKSKSSHKPNGLVSIYRALREIVVKEGPKGLFKGLVPNLVGVAPSRAIYFGVYSFTKSNLETHGSTGDSLHLSSAVVAGFAVATITSPIWLIKTRMQLQTDTPPLSGSPQHTNYKNSLDCVRRVYHEEGIRGFYKGLGASYLGITESSINFVLYERFKSLMLKKQRRNELTSSEYLCIAGVSKLIASILTYPHEVVRTRLREQRAPVPGQAIKYTGILNALKVIAVEEGLAGLYGGMTAHLLRVVPNAAIMFWAYELVVKQLG